EVERGRLDVALGELGLGHMGREFDAVQIGEAALPFGEGRAPIGAVRDFGPVSHLRTLFRGALSATLRASAAPIKRRIWPFYLQLQQKSGSRCRRWRSPRLAVPRARRGRRRARIRR